MPPLLTALEPALGRPLRRRLTGFAALAAALVALTGVPASAADTVLVNASVIGILPLDGDSIYPSVSATGGMIAFASRAVNLAQSRDGGLDINGAQDVFVRYRGVPVTIMVSVNSQGEQGNFDSNRPSIDDFAEFVAFESHATNLVDDDTNNESDVFVHNLSTRRTIRVSVGHHHVQGNNGSSAPAIDRSGRYVAFSSTATNLVPDDTNGVVDVFVHDLTTSLTSRVSVYRSHDDTNVEGNGRSYRASISRGGRYVAFTSEATNLVAGDTNLVADVFRHDRSTGQTERWSVTSNGSQALLGGTSGSGHPAITNSGDKIAFHSDARNLFPNDELLTTDIFLRDP
jgi:hypothetical protein